LVKPNKKNYLKWYTTEQLVEPLEIMVRQSVLCGRESTIKLYIELSELQVKTA